MAIRLIALCDENITITGNMKLPLERQIFNLQQWNKTKQCRTYVINQNGVEYVTTACRLSEVVVSPDGGDLRSGAFHGAVRAPVQRLQQQRLAGGHEGTCPRRRQL
ncbi:hypothetical protein L9F63_016593 [Diploptera punctata]|uniref:Uncharacterized protein n=1 Tax=Diploptera punctata TaxID=6984 RepID=A0AAD8A0S2_DIPPU|nr:hypothetical protein L9F63_016593 [Diploptera punctata]